MALNEYKRYYEKEASNIPDWRNINKNKLVNSFIKNENNKELANSYLAAIICKYWGNIDKLYNNSKSSSVTREDCYEWVIDAIMYALTKRKWLDPSNKLYNDPNGPDKVINRCIVSERKIFYQSSNYDCRKVNYATFSTDQIIEENENNSLLLSNKNDYADIDESVDDLIVSSFNKGKYFLAFMIDGIVNYDSFISFKNKSGVIRDEFSSIKLLKHLSSLDANYAKSFSARFNTNYADTVKAVADCSAIPKDRIRRYIKSNLQVLRTSKVGTY